MADHHDIQPTWASIDSIIQSQVGLAEHSGPGGWNDPDMLQIGNGNLTPAEQRSHIGMWSMLASPMFLGTEIAALPEETLEIIANPEVVTIDQDPLGQQARLVSDRGGLQGWARPLADGDVAVALFNRTEQAATIRAELAELGLEETGHVMRDLADVGAALKRTVGSHDIQMLRFTSVTDKR